MFKVTQNIVENVVDKAFFFLSTDVLFLFLELSAIDDADDNIELAPPLGCSSPVPSCSSSGDTC